MNEDAVSGLLLPAGLAAIGYVIKSLYDLIIERRNKRIENLERKLKHFYWPILIRLEKDNELWRIIMSKKNEPSSLEYRMANSVEKNNIMETQREIMAIIDEYAYLCSPDQDLMQEMKQYVKNATLLKALRDAGEEKIFPKELGVPYPDNFYYLIKKKTESLQQELKQIVF